MLSPDLPIAKLEEDGLNRGSFAESLAKTLVQYSFPSSLTIGLYGEWGSGKTSLLNMVFENVERIDDGVVVLRFNPWLCSDSKQLVTQFFKQMATAIKLKKRAADKAWELIDQYADIRNSIAAPECFDRYFALTLENGAIPTATVRRMVFESSESELAEETMQVYREGKIVRLLEAIEAYAGAGDGRIIDVERTAIIIKVLSCNWSSFEVEDGGFFTVPFAWRLLYCVDPLLKRMDSKARASLMCSIFENEKVQVSTVALLLQDFENQLGRYAENARESADAVLPLDAVLKLEAIFKERAVKAIDSKVVLRQYHGLRFLWLLEQIAPETAADKKKSMVTDDVSLVKIIDECTSRGSVAVRIVAKTRTVDRDRLSEFVDLGEAYQRVKKFATENQFFDLPRDEQMSAVAFILIVERGPVESSLKDCIAEDAIMKALDQMESKIETDDTKRD